MLKVFQKTSLILGLGLAFHSLPARAVLKIITRDRLEFFLYPHSASGNVKELTFTATPPGSNTPVNTIPLEGQAFHDNYFIDCELRYHKQNSENIIQEAWALFKKKRLETAPKIAGQRNTFTSLTTHKNRLIHLLNDRDLKPDQVQRLQQELNGVNISLNSVTTEINRLEKELKDLRFQTVQTEEKAVQAYEPKLNATLQQLALAYDSRTHILISGYDTSVVVLEKMSQNGCQPSYFKGLPPSSQNDWSQRQDFPSVTLKIDRLGEN